MIEGQAVERQTVVAWLNAAYNLADDEVFEQQKENPAGKVAGLVQLIAFADAVGSSKRLMREVLSGAGLKCDVQLGDQLFTLNLLECGYCWFGESPPMLCFRYPKPKSADYTEKGPWVVGHSSGTEQQQALVQELCQQLEALLYLTHHLSETLQQQVLQAIRAQSSSTDSLLYKGIHVLASKRIMGATGSSDLAFVNSILTQPLSFTSKHGLQQQLKQQVDNRDRLYMSPSSPKPYRFEAKVEQDFLDFKKGDTLSVTLDLLEESKITFTYWKNSGHQERSFPVQLLLGAPHPEGWPY